ncbi:MAG: hypothetical protein ACE5G0_21000 [Rhodothermales bacterium]
MNDLCRRTAVLFLLIGLLFAGLPLGAEAQSAEAVLRRISVPRSGDSEEMWLSFDVFDPQFEGAAQVTGSGELQFIDVSALGVTIRISSDGQVMGASIPADEWGQGPEAGLPIRFGPIKLSYFWDSPGASFRGGRLGRITDADNPYNLDAVLDYRQDGRTGAVQLTKVGNLNLYYYPYAQHDPLYTNELHAGRLMSLGWAQFNYYDDVRFASAGRVQLVTNPIGSEPPRVRFIYHTRETAMQAGGSWLTGRLAIIDQVRFRYEGTEISEMVGTPPRRLTIEVRGLDTQQSNELAGRWQFPSGAIMEFRRSGGYYEGRLLRSMNDDFNMGEVYTKVTSIRDGVYRGEEYVRSPGGEYGWTPCTITISGDTYTINGTYNDGTTYRLQAQRIPSR